MLLGTLGASLLGDLLSKCAICGDKKSKFIIQQEVEGLLSKLGIKTSLNKIPILGDILF